MAGAAVGTAIRPDGYIRFQVDGRSYMAHRLAWLYVHGSWPAFEIDHRDGNRANNRIGNLRDVTRTQNNRNRQRVRLDSESGLIGAFKVRGYNRWKARIRINGRQVSLGCFGSAEAAHQAYCAARPPESPLHTDTPKGRPERA